MNILEEISSRRIEDVNKQKKIISLEKIKEQAEKIAQAEYKKNGRPWKACVCRSFLCGFTVEIIFDSFDFFLLVVPLVL